MSQVIEEFLSKIGWNVDEPSFQKAINSLNQMQRAINAISFIDIARAAFDFGKILVDITAKLAMFTKGIIDSDIKAQILARRLYTTTENARSLMHVMSAMGIQSLDQLRDVALNPILRKQFLGLRDYAKGLEPNSFINQGVGDFRQVYFQLQKIQVGLSYFSQYVLGFLGKMFEGPLKRISDNMEFWTTRLKSNFNAWAARAAYFIGYVIQFLRAFWDIARSAFEIAKALKLDHWFMAIVDYALAGVYLLRDIAQGIADLVKHFNAGTRSTIGGAAIGAAAGAAIGVAAAPFTGGASLGAIPELAAIGGGLGAGVGLGSHFMQDAHSATLMNRLNAAQAALESNYGKSAPGFNYFGIKGVGPAGSQLLRTQEQGPNGLYWTHGRFKKYHNAMESLQDHMQLLSSARYRHLAEATTFPEIAAAVKKAGYATDSHYVQKLIDVDRRLQSHPEINIFIDGRKIRPDKIAMKQNMHSTRTLQGNGG